MGKATIVESLGAGYYKIMVKFDNAAIDAKITANTALIAELTAKIIQDANARRDAEDLFKYHLNYLTDFLASTTPEDQLARMEEINHATATVTKVRIDLDLAKKTEREDKLKLTALEKDNTYLEKYCPSEFEAYAWCVAYNEDLTGEIATIEIDRYIRRIPSTNQILDRSTEGIHDKTGFWLPEAPTAPTSVLQHPLASSVHATWFNTCMLPAAQRYKGYYRKAIIIRIDYELNQCDIGIFGDYNVDKFNSKLLNNEPILPRFDVYGTQQQEYRGAKIEYMGGGAETFLVDDLVIVDLHAGVGVPTVIGYYSDPRPGALFYLFSDGVDYPYYFPTFGTSRLKTALKVIENTPLIANIADYTIGFNNDTPIVGVDLLSGLGKKWYTTHGGLTIYTDTPIDGKYEAYIEAFNALPYADPLTLSMQVYKLGILIADVTFTASGYTGDVSPHLFYVNQITGHAFGVIKNGNEGYFSGIT